jgi:hypothetical protein
VNPFIAYNIDNSDNIFYTDVIYIMDTLFIIIFIIGIFLIYIINHNKQDIDNFTQYIGNNVNINKYIKTYDFEDKQVNNIHKKNQKHDNEYRDDGTCGIDRMDDEKPFYHVFNKLLDENEELYTESKYKYNNKYNNKNDTNSVNSFNSIRCDNKNVCDNSSKRKNIKNIVLNDYYEGGSFNDLLKTNDSIDLDKVDRSNFSNSIDICEERDNEKMTNMDGTVCDIKQNTKDLKKYIRDVVLDGRDDCYCATDKTKAEFTRVDADKYREGQIRFRDKILNPSNPIADPVDKENEIRLQGGIIGNGETIADVHDSMLHNKATINGKQNNVKFYNHVEDRDMLAKMMMTGIGGSQIRSNLNHNDMRADIALSNNLPIQPNLSGNGLVSMDGLQTRNNKPFRLNMDMNYDSPINGGIRYDGVLGVNNNLIENNNLLI